MPWKIISGLSESPVGLVTNLEEVQSIEDISDSMRIILPQPGSVQHILLSMGAEKTFGDANYFDNQLLTMSHPDGLNLMRESKGDYLHFTTPPYLQKELEIEAYHQILSGKEAFGDAFTFIVGVCPERVYENTAVYWAFYHALEESMTWMEAHPNEAVKILAGAYDYSEAQIESYLADDAMNFTMEVRGVTQFSNFMVQNEWLKSDPKVESLFWEPVSSHLQIDGN